MDYRQRDLLDRLSAGFKFLIVVRIIGGVLCLDLKYLLHKISAAKYNT